MFKGLYFNLSVEHKLVYKAAMKSLAPKMQQERWSIEKAADEVPRTRSRR